MQPATSNVGLSGEATSAVNGMNGESQVEAPDDGAKPTATIDSDGMKDAMPESMAAAGDDPDGSMDKQDLSTQTGPSI